MNAQTPKQRAQAHIDQIEKRYKTPKNRKAKVHREAVFWSDIWSSMGLQNDPEYKEAMEVYSKYLDA